MIKSLIIMVMMLFLDADNAERLVIKESVDMVEKNHVYYKNDKEEWKLSFIQIIWWEYRKNVLLPEIDPLTKQRTGAWKMGSDYVVVDYQTYKHIAYRSALENKSMSPFLQDGKWVTIHVDSDNDCIRIIEAKQFRETHTRYDVEALNSTIVGTEFRRELIKPRRMKKKKVKLPEEIEALLDMNIEP